MTKLLKLKLIKNNINDDIIKDKDENMQRLESLEYLIRKLEFDKYNNLGYSSFINFSLYYSLADFLYVIYK